MLAFRTAAPLLLAVVLLAAAAAPARAALVFSDAVLVRGPENLTSLELPLDAIGTYRVTATDLRWFGAPLQALSFGVFTATQPLQIMSGAGTLEFFKASPGKIFLQIYTQTVGPQLASLIAVQVEDTAPVPLPASLLLLASALGGGALLRTGRRLRARTSELARLLGERARAWTGAWLYGRRAATASV